MSSLKLLFLDILTDDPKIRREDDQMLADYGGYSGLISRCFGSEHKLIALDAGLSCYEDIRSFTENLGNDKWSGIVIGGSVSNIGPGDKIKDWQTQCFNLISRAVGLSMPVIGFCGGHQYGARCLSGYANTVIKNPLGANRRTSSVIFTNEGKNHALFRGCDNKSLFQWSHSYVVDKLPKGAIRLATHPMTINAAFQAGSFIGLQWHPEFGALPESDYGVKTMKEIVSLHLREAKTDKERRHTEQILLNGIKPTPNSANIFKNWIRIIQEGF